MEIAFGAVFRDSSHDFVRHVGRGGNFAAIKVDGKGYVSLVRKLRRLVFHPIIEAPPFVNYEQARKGAFPRRREENALDSFVAALVGDGFAVSGEGTDREQQNCGDCEEFMHGWAILSRECGRYCARRRCRITTGVPCRACQHSDLHGRREFP